MHSHMHSHTHTRPKNLLFKLLDIVAAPVYALSLLVAIYIYFFFAFFTSIHLDAQVEGHMQNEHWKEGVQREAQTEQYCIFLGSIL